MPDTLVTMYAAGTGGTENAAANIDVQDDGNIVGIQVAHSADLDATDEAATASLSFISTNQITINDTRGELIVSRLRVGLVTAESGLVSTNFYVPMDVTVSGGERLFMHLAATAGVLSDCSMVVHFNFRRTPPRRSQRRR